MKELLYKPNNQYVSFVIDWDKPYGIPIYSSLEDYCVKWTISEEAVIRNILCGNFDKKFHEKNNIPKTKQLKETDFKIVEV